MARNSGSSWRKFGVVAAIGISISCCIYTVMFIQNRQSIEQNDISIIKDNGRFRRSTDFFSHVKYLCQLVPPSDADIIELSHTNQKKTEYFNFSRSDQTLCILKEDCLTESWTATCATVKCQKYVILYYDKKKSLSVERNVDTIQEVQIVLEELFRFYPSLTENNVLVGCANEDPVSESLSWNIQVIRQCDDIHHNTYSKQSVIHIIYIRFMSRHGFVRYLPETAKILEEYSDLQLTLDFKKYQSISILESVNIRNIFEGQNEYSSKSEKSSLKQAATNAGFKMKIFDHNCIPSHLRTRVLSESLSECDHIFKDNISYRLCRAASVDTFVMPTTMNGICSSATGKSTTKPHRSPFGLFDHLNLITNSKVITFSFLNKLDFDDQDDMDYLDQSINVFLRDQMKIGGLVVLLSDVGDIHVRDSLFANTEIFNPFLYLISTKLPMCISEDVMYNTNQMITIYEVHDALLAVMSRGGICLPDDYVHVHARYRENHEDFTSTRLNSLTCSDVKLRAPVLCICIGMHSQFNNDSIQVGHAEFALGQMNNLIQDALANDTESFRPFAIPSFAICHKLKGIKFINVEVKTLPDRLRTSMIIHVLSWQCDTRYDIIKFQVSVDTMYGEVGYQNARLTHFKSDNFTSTCSPVTILNNICICGNRSRSPRSISTDKIRAISVSKNFGVYTRSIHLHAGCLFLFIRDYNTSVTFEASNLCDDKEYIFWFSLDLINMISLVPLPVFRMVKPFQTKYLSTAVQTTYLRDDVKLRYKTSFTASTL